MVPDQMVCIVAYANELAPANMQALRNLALNGNELDALFERIGKVHFASIALLPPGPDPGARVGTPSALILELAVDDGVPPVELVELLVEHGFTELWGIYGAFWQGGEHASDRTHREWLHGFLLRNLHQASGGFVGARDRSVGQIHAEARLFQSARAELYQLPLTPADDRASMARAISAWARGQEEFGWATEPARRSFWRSASMAPLVRMLLVLARLGWGLALTAVLLNVLAAVAFMGVLTLAVALMATDLSTLLDTPAVFGAHYQWSRYAVIAVSALALVMTLIASSAVSGIRSATVAAFLLLIFGVVLLLLIVAGYCVFGGEAFRGFIGATGVLIAVGLAAAAWVAAVWLAVGLALVLTVLVSPPCRGLSTLAGIFLALVLLAAWLFHFLLAGLVDWSTTHGPGLLAVMHRQFALGLPAIDAIAILVLALFSILVFMLSQAVRLPPFNEHEDAQELDRVTAKEELRAGHQVHASVDACEAALAAAGRPNHMFSLTEIRRPYWLNSLMLRFFLRLVTTLGHILFTEGKLARAEGIRFGHWHVLGGGRRLLFCSNFDGGFGGYLDEFINGASEGVNLFWRWTELLRRPAAVSGHPEVSRMRKFPPTRRLVYGGCKYEQWFKTYARDSMLPHLYRFEAYGYSAKDVERAGRLRDALFGLRTAVNDDIVIRALES